MDIRSAAHALGGDVVNRATVVIPGPGHSRNDRSLSVTFDATAPDGFLVQSFANDDWQDCKDHVRQMLGLGGFRPGRAMKYETVSYLPPASEPVASSHRDFAMSLWGEAKPIGGTPVESYLTGRGIILVSDAYTGLSIRHHPACPFKLDSGETVRLTAMLALMVNIVTGEPQGVHRTALAADGGGKAKVRGLDDPKKMLGSSKAAAVKLSPDDSVSSGLAIAEGIETALAVAGNFGISPIWATLSAGAMARFPVLSGIESLSIFSDNDKPKMQGSQFRQAGNDAARQCAANWISEGKDVTIWAPPVIGTDFNDISRSAA